MLEGYEPLLNFHSGFWECQVTVVRSKEDKCHEKVDTILHSPMEELGWLMSPNPSYIENRRERCVN
jgi:hypothetical protein